MKKKKIILPIIIAIIVLGFAGFFWFYNKNQNIKTTANFTSEKVYINQNQESFSYKGVEGKDALTLLKEKAKIEQSNSGLVIVINGRKASDQNKEFWAFYINRKMAEVGPADYQTKTGDLIEWKIKKY
jgi:hypothetical protein